MNDYRYLLLSRRYGLLGVGDDIDEMTGLMMARVAYEDMVYVLDQKEQRYSAFQKCQWGVERLFW